MENFKHGLKCHDFVPIDGASPGSYYTYQMFGDNRIQVTNYVEDGMSYVAGFCIYIENPCWKVSFREEIIRDLFNSLKYPGRTFNDESNEEKEEVQTETENLSGCLSDSVEILQFDDENHAEEIAQLTIKHCQKLQRLVMSSSKSGKVVHQEWDKNENEMKFEECKLCTEKFLYN